MRIEMLQKFTSVLIKGSVRIITSLIITAGVAHADVGCGR